MTDFSFASADDRTLTVAAYLGGTVELLLIVVPLAWAAWRLRATFLPAWLRASWG